MGRMIALPREYGELPERYGVPIPADYGDPSAGLEGRPNIHEVGLLVFKKDFKFDR